MKKYMMNFCEGPIAPAMVQFAVPLMLTNLLQMLYNAVDAVIVGRFVSSSALGAVGTSMPVIGLILNVAFGLSAGGGILMAQAVGAKDAEKCERVVHTAVLLGSVIGALLLVLGPFIGRLLLGMMGVPENVIGDATLYMNLYFLGIVGTMVCTFGCAILRAAGDSRRPMIFLMISGIVNVILDLLFVAVLSMGIAGAAIATVIAQYVSAVFTLIALKTSDGALRLEWKRLKLYKDTFLQMVRVGVPIGMQGAVFNIANVIIQASVNTFGSDAMAGYTAADNIGGFIYIGLNCIGQTATTFAGQNFGAKAYGRVKKTVWWSFLFSIVVSLVLSAVAVIFGESLIRIYNPGNSVAVEYGMILMLYVNGLYVIYGLIEVFSGSVRGMGITFAPMLVSVLGICGVRVAWVYTVFQSVKSLESLVLAFPVSWAITALFFFLFYLYIKKKKLQE